MVQAADREAKQAAVTPERFAGAKTYAQYRESITQNQQKFDDNYNGTKVSEALTQRLRQLTAKANGPAKVVVSAEAWCPDVYRGLPVMQRVAEAAGWDLRVLERDQNLDVAEQFKKEGQFLSVPTAIFYTKDMKYITHFAERSDRVTAEMARDMHPLTAAFTPAGLATKLGREPNDDEKAEAQKERQKVMDAFQTTNPAWARWRDMTVEDITATLEEATK